jgi:sirohydrochlorin cobaltochelatase
MTPTTDPGATAVVLAAHGAPPTDYPRMRVGVLIVLESSPRRLRRLPFMRRWHDRLASEVCGWPRTRVTDPYKAAVDDLAEGIATRLGFRVLPGYNEFCAPAVDEAIELVIDAGATTVLVLPTMLLGGNSHTESEIRTAVSEAHRRHPDLRIEYAWPFSQERMVALFAGQVLERLGGDE